MDKEVTLTDILKDVREFQRLTLAIAALESVINLDRLPPLWVFDVAGQHGPEKVVLDMAKLTSHVSMPDEISFVYQQVLAPFIESLQRELRACVDRNATNFQQLALMQTSLMSYRPETAEQPQPMIPGDELGMPQEEPRPDVLIQAEAEGRVLRTPPLYEGTIIRR